MHGGGGYDNAIPAFPSIDFRERVREPVRQTVDQDANMTSSMCTIASGEIRRLAPIILERDPHERESLERVVGWLDGVSHSLSNDNVVNRRPGGIEFKPEMLLKAFRTSQMIHSKSNLGKVSERCVDMVVPRAMRESILAKLRAPAHPGNVGAVLVPKRSTVTRSALSVDAMYICYLRATDPFKNANLHPLADSSPQGNHDWLNSCFFYVLEKDFKRVIMAAHFLSNNPSQSDADDIDLSLARERAKQGQLIVDCVRKHTQVTWLDRMPIESLCEARFANPADPPTLMSFGRAFCNSIL